MNGVLKFVYFLSVFLVCDGLQVLSTTKDLSDFKTCSGAKLLNPREIEFGDISICLRFLEYQILSKTLISSKDELRLGQNKVWENVEDISRNKYTFKIVETSFSTSWTFRHWNHLCMSFNNKTSITQIVGNGKLLMEDEDQRSRRRPLSKDFLHNLLLMSESEDCKNGNTEKNALFGQMTDVNIWDQALSLKSLKSWTSCEKEEKGNIVNWDNDAWITWGGVLETMDISEICKKPGDIGLTLFPLPRTAQQSMDLCEAFGGEMAVANNKEAVQKMMKLVKEETEHCPIQRRNIVFAGYTDIQNEGQFLDMNSGNVMEWEDWGDGQPNDSGGEDCIVLKESGEMNDKMCDLKMCTLCMLKTIPVLNLRGACPEENLDMTFMMLFNSMKEGRYEILGLSKTKLTWDGARWTFVNMVTGDIVAYTEDTKDYPVGTWKWYFQDKKCSDPGENWRMMNLHQACSDTKFACRNGFWIDSEYRCDGNFDCKDFSDEINCNLVNTSLTPNYDKENPPPIYKFKSLKRLGDDGKTAVTAHFEAFKLIDINEIDSSFSIQFTLTLTWRDPRLSFNFLKSSSSENLIQNQTWTPQIEFVNFRKSLSEYSAQVIVVKEGKPIRNGNHEVDKKETYEGTENSIIKRQVYQAQFNCFFDNLKHYPFDTEYCMINMTIAGSAYDFTNFKIDQIVSKEGMNDDVSGYSIIDVQMMETKFHNDKNGILVTIQLDRDIINILLSTYLPTVLMIIINQISNYFGNENYFDTIISVNLTCMMVLSALYISVNNSLPPTTTIKKVDIWLLFSLVYPFTVVLINSYIHYIRAMENETNEETKVYKFEKIKSFQDYLKYAYELGKRPISLKFKIKVANFVAIYVIPCSGIIFATYYFYDGFKTFFDDTK